MTDDTASTPISDYKIKIVHDFPSPFIMHCKHQVYLAQKTKDQDASFTVRVYDFMNTLHQTLYEQGKAIIHRRLSFDNKEVFRIDKTSESLDGEDWLKVKQILINREYQCYVLETNPNNGRYALCVT